MKQTMQRTAMTTFATCAAMALAACGSSSDDSAAQDGPAAPVAADSIPASTEPADTSPIPASPDTAVVAAIPAAMQGRWGMVPADCTSTRGDAKGLITVSAKDIRFYESVGTLGTISQGDANHIRANFAFTGEGMEWTREMDMAIEDGGEVLIRQEFGQDAIPGPQRYTKCKAA